MQANPCSGSHRGDDVEQPQDVHRWRRDLEAIAVGEPERGDPVLDRVAERPVRVAHRLGQAGRAGAEHQHRVGVGVVDARDRARPDAGGSRSSGSTGRKAAPSASAAHPASSPTARSGPTTPPACWISVAFHAGLTITTDAPSCSAPYTANTNSGRFADIRAMRVPRPAPAAASAAAHSSARDCTSPNVKLRSSKSSATRSRSPVARRRSTSVSVRMEWSFGCLDRPDNRGTVSDRAVGQDAAAAPVPPARKMTAVVLGAPGSPGPPVAGQPLQSPAYPRGGVGAVSKW